MVITSIDELALAGIKIYPNPTNGNITITTPNKFDVFVYDVLGNLVYEQLNNNLSLNIDLTDKTEGIYFLTIKSGDFITTQKIVFHNNLN